MISEVDMSVFRRDLDEMLDQVQYRKDSILIRKDGKLIAALIDAALFLRIHEKRERFAALSDRIAQNYADVPIGSGMAEIDAAVTVHRKSA